MGIIRNHLLQMKVENPAEYKRLMMGYNNEDEFVKDVLGLSVRAINYYLTTGGNKSGSSKSKSHGRK